MAIIDDKSDMNIFELSNYKAIIQSILTEKRKLQKGISRQLAEYLNVHPSMISQALTGNKDFSEEQMILITEFLGLPQLESQYLLILLQQERAGSVKLKKYYDERRIEVQKKALSISERVVKNKTLSDKEKAIFYSHWLYPTVHLLSTLDKKPRFEEICKKLDISAVRAREILDFLIEIHMVVEKDGVFFSGPVATHLEKSSPFLPKHHTNWRLKAIQYSDEISDQELMYTASISINKKDFEKIREEFLQSIQKMVKIVNASPAEDIAQINLDLFWIKK